MLITVSFCIWKDDIKDGKNYIKGRILISLFKTWKFSAFSIV